MPVTARLVQRLREALGDEATDDLFAWFEEAGWVNRATVREIADLYFERFESRLEQEVARLESKLGQEVARIEAKLGQEVARLEAKLGQEIGRLEAKLGQEIRRLESKLEQGLHGVRAEFQAALASQRADLVKWMFMFWLGTILPLAGLMVALLRL